MTIDLLPFHVADGATQMGIDDAMLAHAEAGTASLRCYDWSTPTLSLGYFQPSSERLAIPSLAALPWLRRATGGAAILHGDGDLTYALALPADPAWHAGEPWLCRFHHLLQRAFKSMGLQTRAVVCGEEVKREPVLCFQHHTPGDLVEGGVKVVGSAQRKQRGALLQHGTIRLRTSRHLPQLPGLEELTGTTVDAAVLMSQLVCAFEAETGAKCRRVGLPAHDSRRYRDPEWNERR